MKDERLAGEGSILQDFPGADAIRSLIWCRIQWLCHYRPPVCGNGAGTIDNEPPGLSRRRSTPPLVWSSIRAYPITLLPCFVPPFRRGGQGG